MVQNPRRGASFAMSSAKYRPTVFAKRLDIARYGKIRCVM